MAQTADLALQIERMSDNDVTLTVLVLATSRIGAVGAIHLGMALQRNTCFYVVLPLYQQHRGCRCDCSWGGPAT